MGGTNMDTVNFLDFFTAQAFPGFSRRNCMNQAALTTEICKRLKLA